MSPIVALLSLIPASAARPAAFPRPEPTPPPWPPRHDLDPAFIVFQFIWWAILFLIIGSVVVNLCRQAEIRRALRSHPVPPPNYGSADGNHPAPPPEYSAVEQSSE